MRSNKAPKSRLLRLSLLYPSDRNQSKSIKRIWGAIMQIIQDKSQKHKILSFIKDKIIILVVNFIYKRYESYSKTKLS